MNQYQYPGKLAHTLTGEMIDPLLLWAVDKGASDIVFRANDPPWLQIDGIWREAANFSVSAAECEILTNYFSGQSHKAGNVQSGRTADFAYSLATDERGRKQRFRVNITGTNAGHYVVMRALPTRLPLMGDLGLEQELVENIYPPNGIVIVSGVMGSGKSTLLAGVIHSAILKKEFGGEEIGRQILTLEQPVEFDFAALPHERRCAPIAQSEIGLHVKSWGDGVRSMTRRKGEIVMVGEARDKETLESMISTVEQGVTAYATVHAQDVPQTITRIVNTFPEEEHASVASVLKANLRMIIHQRLVPRLFRPEDEGKKIPGRIALREYLVFTESLRMQLYDTEYDDLIPKVREMVIKYGQPLVKDAWIKYQAKQISDETYASIRHEQETNLAPKKTVKS